MSDEKPGHPHLGDSVEVIQNGPRVALVLNCHTEDKAVEIAHLWLQMLMAGKLELTLTGNPTGYSTNETRQ